jgi:hypothetical protein
VCKCWLNTATDHIAVLDGRACAGSHAYRYGHPILVRTDDAVYTKAVAEHGGGTDPAADGQVGIGLGLAQIGEREQGEAALAAELGHAGATVTAALADDDLVLGHDMHNAIFAAVDDAAARHLSVR